ncbi:PAS domain S-box protein [Roseateles sp. MS654]|uniref:PAS domain S-box protein n=1 Tax=Roseateles sp. MS654 TaxID=3412685 RepID=UPI003C2EAEF2
MKISTRFAIVGAACALAALAIAAALGRSGEQVADSIRKNREAADIVESVAGLRYLTLEYARQPEARVEAQWTRAYRTLGIVLQRAQGFDSHDEAAGVAQIRAAYDQSPAVFAELVRARHAEPAGEADRQVLDDWTRRLTAAMSRHTQIMMTESFRLQDISREEVSAAQHRAFVIVLALSGALAVLVAGSMFFVFRGIARPLARLREGMERVGAGDLAHTIGDTGSNEIADLARQFDRMSALLRDTTVSRDRLAESEARTRLILDAALDAVIGMDGEGAITHWNPQAEAIFGWTREEAVGQTLAELVVPERFRDAHRAGLRRYLDTGLATVLDRRVELRATRRDGSEFPIELAITAIRAGGAVSFNAFLRDITERKLGEARLKAQLARLDLLNQITRAIGERQDTRSIFQAVIRHLEDHAPVDFCGVYLRDAMGDSLRVAGVGARSAPLALEMALPEQADLPIDGNGLSQCVKGHLVYEPDVAEIRFPFPQRLARGGLRSLVMAPLQSEGRVFGVLVAARREPQAFSSSDCEFLQQLSEHVSLASHQAQLHAALQQAYEDLRQTQQAILQQERLRALGAMASGIAHDINNAISPAMLYTESLLEREPGMSPSARRALENIARAIDDVAATVTRMREFYRERETGLALARVRLNELVRQVVELTRARWSDMPQQRGAVIRLRTELDGDDPVVLGTDNELREALINLVFNAVDAMPEGGELTIRTATQLAPAESADLREGPRPVLLEVVDNGVGMDEATRRRCLEPFFTTKGERGTGLGLAMVYGIAQRHGAELDIRSEVGAGTRVSLRFAAPPAGAAAVATRVEPDERVPPLRILLVDDDPLLLRSLQETLEADGHAVTTANAGQGGIDAFRHALRSTAFDIVISDLGMPHVDGRQVAAAIKTASPQTPVILLTGWGQRLVDDGEVPRHVDQVLSKPPRLREVRAALARLAPDHARKGEPA